MTFKRMINNSSWFLDLKIELNEESEQPEFIKNTHTTGRLKLKTKQLKSKNFKIKHKNDFIAALK